MFRLIHCLIAAPLFLAFTNLSNNEISTTLVGVHSTSKIEDSLKTTSIQFAVDSVEIATDFLPVDSTKAVFENKIGQEIIYYSKNKAETTLVHSYNNGLIQTLQYCYDEHRPLILSPDAIWLTICQGVSIHVNQNFKSLEPLIFKVNKPENITVRNDDLENSSDQWATLISDLSTQTKAYTKKDIYSFFVPKFSTTTETITTSYQITLLKAVRKAFAYIGESGCGIPSIQLTGTKKDWEDIYTRLNKLDQFNLSEWKETLKPIIAEFIAVFDGNIKLEFWQDIFKNASEYNGQFISGWIIKFFPYTETVSATDYDNWDDINHGYRVNKLYKPNPFLKGNHYLRSTLSTASFPSGISQIDLEWKNYNTNETKNMLIYGGIFAIKQYPNKSLEPYISWAISEKNGNQIKRDRNWRKPTDIAHNNEYWSPHIARKLIDSAVYDIKTFSNQKNSLHYLQTYITNSLANNPKTKNLPYKGITIEFTVLTNGKLDEITLTEETKVNTILKQEIEKLLLNLPKPWSPALAYPKHVLRLMGVSSQDDGPKINANSKVILVL